MKFMDTYVQQSGQNQGLSPMTSQNRSPGILRGTIPYKFDSKPSLFCQRPS